MKVNVIYTARKNIVPDLSGESINRKDERDIQFLVYEQQADITSVAVKHRDAMQRSQFAYKQKKASGSCLCLFQYQYDYLQN